MLNTVILCTFATAIIAMLISAAVKIKKDQVREERDYWIQECAIREREAQFFAEMDERLVPRIMNRFGHNMQDYLIDRHLRQRYEEAYNELVIEQEYEEPTHSAFVSNNTQDEDDPIVGYNLSEPNPVIRQSDILRMRAEKAAQEKKTKARPQSKVKLTSDFSKPNATEEKTFFNKHDLMKDDFWEDNTAYDWADDDNENLLISAEPTQSKIIPLSKAKSGNGRPKIYSSPAAKQQAYRDRERQKQRMAAHA